MIIVIGNYAKQTLLKKEKEFALLLATNINHQIYQRFVLPTVLGYGRIELKNKEQYERLDQVIDSTIHGFKVLELQIYDLNGRPSYSTWGTLQQRPSLAKTLVKRLEAGEIIYNQHMPARQRWFPFSMHVKPRSYILTTLFPLRTERSLTPAHKGNIIGLLEFSQDISSDYETINYFQLLIIVVVLISSIMLFILLYIIILKADRILAERLKEKQKLERELVQTEKLASMGRMVATISHEIKNPLGIIQSSSEFLSKRSCLQHDPSSLKLAKAIFTESKRLTKIVNDFLDYARPPKPQMRDIDLKQIITQALHFLQPEFDQKGIQVHLHLGTSIPLKGDKDLLYRVVYNILNNSCQAIAGPGEIGITWFAPSQELHILDTGPGFDPDFQDKYLEPFFTTKETGTGLGLAIVYNILNLHGATLELKRAPHQGGLVIIRFHKPAS